MKTIGWHYLRQAAMLCVLLIGAPVVAIGTNGQPPIQISFICATQRVIPPEVQAMARNLMAKYQDQGVANYGDRAAVVKFGDPPTDVYFIPLSCGATGNCVWGVVASAPTRNLGALGGAVIRVPRGPGWPVIEAFTHLGAGEGDLETLVHRGEQYHRKSNAKLKPEAADRFMSCVDNEACCPAASNLTRP